MLTNSRLLTTLFLFISYATFAQYQIGLIPRLSPEKTVSAKLNYTNIEIAYGSPKVRGRKVWGTMIPYDKIWRAGADYATTIEISHEITIQDQELPKGKYSMFLIPSKDDEWEVVFNKVHRQWGAFDYDENENILSVFATPTSNTFQEELNYEIQDLGLGSGKISFQWENLKLDLSINTSFIDQLKMQVVTRADTLPNALKFAPYLQGAQHLVNNSDEIEVAEVWINKAEKLFDPNAEWNENFYPKIYIESHIQWISAKVLARQGEYEKALKIVAAMKISDEKYTFYNYMGKRDQVDEFEAAWKKGKSIKFYK